MIKVFFDTEFTHLEEPLLPEPAELISLGCISQDEHQFYAENADFNLDACSDFVEEIVLPFLKGGDVSMPYQTIAKALRQWVEALDDEVMFYSDAPYYDWPFIKHLFDTWGWPANLVQNTGSLVFMHKQEAIFQSAVDQVVKARFLRKHHALDDAIAIKYAYERVMDSRF